MYILIFFTLVASTINVDIVIGIIKLIDIPLMTCNDNLRICEKADCRLNNCAVA